jgi:radical SAM protein with 4Fe4S-binding SPASM domain
VHRAMDGQIVRDGLKSSGCFAYDDRKRALLAEVAREFSEIVRRSLHEAVPLSWPEQIDDDSAVGNADEYAFSLIEPLRFGKALTFHYVDSRYLWISTFEASLLVLDQTDHEMFLELRKGSTPQAVLPWVSSRDNIDEKTAWDKLGRLIARIVAAGFIPGIRGYAECKVPTPAKFSRLHLTKACHLECIHCYAESSPSIDRKNEITTERWGKLIQDFASNGGEQVLFTGGEALMHRGCIELMKLSKTLGLYVTLFSNGLLIPKHIGDLGLCVDKVQVSLDGPDEASNDAIRGNGVFRAVVKAIDALLGARIPTQVGMTVMEQNWEAWKSGFLQFAERYAGTPIEFKLSYGINTYGRAENMTEMDVNVTRPTVDALMSRVSGHKGAKVFRAQSGCGYAEQLVVGPDGTVYPCHLLDAPICHINDRPLPEIISVLRNIARRVDVDHVEGCDECDIRYLCGGTCRVLDSRKSGTRLKTTCTPEIKARKYQAFVEHFG